MLKLWNIQTEIILGITTVWYEIIPSQNDNSKM